MENFKNKITRITYRIIFLVITLVIMLPENINAATITVPDDYPTIQQAANAASAGDIVFVRAGTYYEHVTINKSLTLQGEDRETTIIDGGGIGHVIYITAHYITISGLTVANGENGIKAPSSIYINHLTLKDVIITLNHQMAFNILHNGGNHLIENCIISDNYSVSYSHQFNNSIIRNNEIFGNQYGLSVGWGSNTFITNNHVHHNIGRGIHFDSMFNSIIEKNNIHHNGSGVTVGYVGSNNTIRDNIISHNSVGVRFHESRVTNNRVYHNDFIDNTVQAQDIEKTNIWDNGYPSGGNYYNDYTGEDLNNDGIGDTPYVFTNNQDNYPLMHSLNNLPPVADCQNITASADENCEAIVTAEMVNNNSYDPDGDPLTLRLDLSGPFQLGETEVTLTVEDDSGETDQCTATITVEDNIAPSVVTQDITVQLDENGNALIAPEDVDDGSSDACGIASLSVSPNVFICANVGENTVTLSVTDVNGNSASTAALVTVINNAPEIISVIGPINPEDIGSLTTLNISFDDTNASNVNVAWGDGLDDDYDASIGLVAAEHSYGEPGVYSVNVKVTDVCGQFDVFDYKYVVIYDPSAGFVTGGGWIMSPEGAYVVDPNLSGKANFGFVSKYKKGQITPDGNTEFQFKAGNLNFKSTEYEWLVIAGAKAKFKGVGTINDAGNYGFMLSAVDAELTPSTLIDKFRIKIWDKDNGDVIVYDNNITLDETAEAATEIGGGSIVIHSVKNKSAQIEPDNLVKVENFGLQVYPNPFSDKVIFEFVSPGDTHARIDMFDVTGRMVKTVFNNPVKEGVSYNIGFSPETSNSSYFIYRMILGEEIYNGKILYNK